MSDRILEVRDLCVSYGDFLAVDSVCLPVQQGQILSLIGLNNAGKSTLVNTIAKLLEPTSGSIVFKGEDVTKLPPEKIVLKGISLVSQGGRCFHRMSVEDNLLMGAYPKTARAGAKESLDQVFDLFPDLKTMRRTPAGSLSGGQRQMVAIGRALMNHPDLLIFDEISLGLSPTVIKDLYKRIACINRDFGTSMIIIEQNTHRALKSSHSFCVMLKGKIVLSGDSGNADQDEIKKAYFGV